MALMFVTYTCYLLILNSRWLPASDSLTKIDEFKGKEVLQSVDCKNIADHHRNGEDQHDENMYTEDVMKDSKEIMSLRLEIYG